MFKLGNILGIKVYLHWTVGILAAIILPPMFQYSNQFFGSIVSGILSVLMVVGFVGSVLFHEFAHCLAARKFGFGTRRITLFVFGGAAELDGGWLAKPKHEFWIALAGPVSSLVLAGVLFVMALVVGMFVSLGLGQLIGTLAFTNFILGMFNLLPIFPCDGGRLLRSTLWWWFDRRTIR